MYNHHLMRKQIGDKNYAYYFITHVPTNQRTGDFNHYYVFIIYY